MIIFNKKEYHNNLIKNGFEKHINKRDLIILAKTLKSEKPNIEETEIKNHLIEFCKKWVENFNTAKYENYILSILKIVSEPLKARTFVSPISFKAEELKQIMVLQDFNSQNLLFIIMCICKMYNRDNIYLNSKSSIKLKELCELAKIKLSAEKQIYLLHTLYKEKFVEVGKNLKLTLICSKNIDETNIVLEFEPCLKMVDFFIDYKLSKNGLKINKKTFKKLSKIKRFV